MSDIHLPFPAVLQAVRHVLHNENAVTARGGAIEIRGGNFLRIERLSPIADFEDHFVSVDAELDHDISSLAVVAVPHDVGDRFLNGEEKLSRLGRMGVIGNPNFEQFLSQLLERLQIFRRRRKTKLKAMSQRQLKIIGKSLYFLKREKFKSL